MLVEFVSVVDAVRCAVDIQRGMAERISDLPAEKRIEFRVGINVGDIISDSNDIYGDGVNVAARLEALADPGGIMVSRTVHDQVRDKLSFGFKDMGEQPVKNIARPSASPDHSSLTKITTGYVTRLIFPARRRMSSSPHHRIWPICLATSRSGASSK